MRILLLVYHDPHSGHHLGAALQLSFWKRTSHKAGGSDSVDGGLRD
jgi:hypothetical protein